jgi:tRNA nucleotidyltransferase (CCA-adding enzyme)
MFTVNAIYIPVSSKKKTVVDLYNGRGSIKHRKIKTVRPPAAAIKRDPLIMLKAISLSAEIHYKIDNNLFYAIKAHSELLRKVPKESIRHELFKILLSHKPSTYLKIMEKCHLLHIVIPELSACYGVKQNSKYHKYDVFSHCLIACDNTPPNLVLRLAALLHDVGKVSTREEIVKDGQAKITFYNHEVAGARIAKKVLRRLKFPDEIIDQVSFLIYSHMYNYEPEIWTDAAVRRFIKKVGITENDLEHLEDLPIFLIRKADRASYGREMKEVSVRQKMFEDRIRSVYNKSKALRISDLEIDGSLLMEYFSLQPGPTIGNILNHLLNMVIEDQSLNDKDRLIEEASKYLSNALK